MEPFSSIWFELSATRAALPGSRVALKKTGGTLIVIGALMAVAGALMLWNTFAATQATVFVLGVFLATGGVMNTIHAFTIRRWNLALLDVLAAVVYFVAAVFTFRQPVAAAETVTILLAALFMVGGAMRFIGSLAMQPVHWGWLMLQGAVTFMLGMLLFTGLPVTGLVGPGLLVGIDLLFSGITGITFGVAARDAARREEAKEPAAREIKPRAA